jgi:membrane protein
MIRIPIKELASIVKLTLRNWQQDRAPRIGAALACYMALTLAPMVVIILAVTGLAFGAKAAQCRLVGQIQGLVGREGAVVIQSMIEGAHRSSSGIVATVFGLATLFFGALPW